MSCLLCRYFQATEPPQHRAEREAGRCRSSCGRDWDQHTALHYVRNHGHLDGLCLLHPGPTRHVHNHVCGDISVRTDWPFRDARAFTAYDNLAEWAAQQLQVVLHGTWQEQERNKLRDENEELRRQLKRVREISASRLARLQSKQPEPKAEPAVKPLPKFKPRLVAAE